MKDKLSIITICRNAADILPVTIESVLAQDYDNYEYIIKDGNSSDNTGEIVRSYAKEFAAKGVNLVYNSESDGGIYDAMNRAATLSDGAYINYMNAGDCFFDAGVLTRVADAADGAVIIYGDCVVYEYGRFYRFQKSLANIDEGMPFSHQSVFAASDFLRSHPFDTSLRYSADYDFLLTAYDMNVRFIDAKTIVCITTADGTSSINYHDTLMESTVILQKHGRFHHSERDLARMERSLTVKQFVMDHFPAFVKGAIRGIQIKSRGQGIDVTPPAWFHV